MVGRPLQVLSAHAREWMCWLKEAQPGQRFLFPAFPSPIIPSQIPPCVPPFTLYGADALRPRLGHTPRLSCDRGYHVISNSDTSLQHCSCYFFQYMELEGPRVCSAWNDRIIQVGKDLQDLQVQTQPIPTMTSVPHLHGH